MRDAFDIAILGSGFAGSLLAMVARRLGFSVLILERGSHPRFAIGESTSPMTNLLLEELAIEYDLPRLLPFCAYGTWKQCYADVAVGLKRGFTFYHHTAGKRFEADPERGSELLVAASPNDIVADTHWYREDFDHFLVREAQDFGAEYVDRTSVTRLGPLGGVSGISGDRMGRRVEFRAAFVVDATGPRGALSRLLDLPERPLIPGYPGTQALFSHFTGVSRFADLLDSGNGRAPYPPDAAALHHVFEGGWMWVLRFDNGITSAGFAVEDRLAADLGLPEGAAAWDRFLARYPSIGDQFAGSEAVRPFVHMPRLSYRCEGPAWDRRAGWAMLPSANAFVDPLFSTGFPLTLLGIQRLTRALAEARSAPGAPSVRSDYVCRSAAETDNTALLTAACYATFGDFRRFAPLTMLYFVAASYSEMARRLGRPHLAPEFLLGGRGDFHDRFLRHCTAAMQGRPSSASEIERDMEPFNVAGLCDPAKRNHYPVDLEEVVRASRKLEATGAEVRQFIAAMGW